MELDLWIKTLCYLWVALSTRPVFCVTNVNIPPCFLQFLFPADSILNKYPWLQIKQLALYEKTVYVYILSNCSSGRLQCVFYYKNGIICQVNVNVFFFIVKHIQDVVHLIILLRKKILIFTSWQNYDSTNAPHNYVKVTVFCVFYYWVCIYFKFSMTSSLLWFCCQVP